MQILVPIFCGGVLPIAIVLIVFIASMNRVNKRAQVLIKAIESNSGVNVDKLAEALGKPKKTPREILNGRLLRGCIYTLIGIFLLAIGIYNYATLEAYVVNDSGTFPSLAGGICLAIGISYLIVYFVSRNQADAPEEK